ncbi:MAG: hypothetical protein KF861_14195 [Planctomycetaceae bacterium]|nr:hypothetical protein [Planctomycetaceae bacterium]
MATTTDHKLPESTNSSPDVRACAASDKSQQTAPLGQGADSGRASAIALWGVLLVVNIVPIWLVDYFPAQNGPWFLASVHIFKEINNPELGYSEYYQRSWFPIPHLSFDGGVLLLSQVLPLRTAENIMYSITFALVPLGVLYFLSVVAPQRKALALLSFLMIYSYPLMRGYSDFVISIPVFFITFGYWLKWKDTAGPRQYAVLAVLALLLYLSHLIAFLLLSCTIGWYQLRKGAGWWGATRSAAAATWSGWPLVIAYLTLNKSSSEWIAEEDTKWNPVHWNVQYFVERFFMTVSEPAYIVALAAWSWVVVLLVLSARNDSRGIWAWCRTVALSPLGSLVLVLFASYLVLPDHIIGWHKFNQRFIPFVLISLLGLTATLVSDDLYRRVRRPLTVTVAMAALLVPLLVTRELFKMDAALKRYTAAIDKLPMRSRVLPIMLENMKFGLIYPLTRAHEYYLMERGGGNGGGIASMNTLAMVWYKHYPLHETFPMYRDDMTDAEFAEILTKYDHVLLWGGDQHLDEQVQAAQFQPLHVDDSLRLYGRMESPHL